jgi:hypothetical protein
MDNITRQLFETYKQIVLKEASLNVGAPGQQGEPMQPSWRLPKNVSKEKAVAIGKDEMAKRKAEWNEADNEEFAATDPEKKPNAIERNFNQPIINAIDTGVKAIGADFLASRPKQTRADVSDSKVKTNPFETPQYRLFK